MAHASATSAWLAFKYDASDVLFYVCETTVSSSVQQPERAYADPIATWGAGGILVNPTQTVLSESSCRESLNGLAIGDHINITSDGKHVKQAVIQKYVEQWGSQIPLVRVGVIARLIDQVSDDNYFLAFRGALPIGETKSKSIQIKAMPKVLAHLGGLGEIVLFKGDAGWLVALCKYGKSNNTFVATNISYSYGD